MQIKQIEFLNGENKIISSENVKWSIDENKLSIATDNIKKIYLKTGVKIDDDTLVLADAF